MAKKWFKRLLKCLLFLFLLITCAWWFENWRGARAWEEAQERAEEARFSLDLADYQPPPAPDEENLLKNSAFLKEWNEETEPRLQRWSSATTPGLKKYPSRSSQRNRGTTMDYRQYFEEELTEDQAIQRLDELTRDLQQRQNKLIEVVLSYPARNLGSSSVPTEKSPIPSGPVLKIQRLARALSDQALLSLHLQKPDVAFRIIECLRRLEKNFCRGTMLRSLVGLSLHRVIDSIIWEGIRLHSWDQEHLAILSNQLQQLDYSSDLEKVAKFETIFGIHSVDHLEHIAEASSQFWSEIWDLNEEMTLKEKVQIYLKTEGPDGWRGQRKAILVNDALSFLADHKNGELDYVGSRKIDPDNNNYDPFEYSRSHGETLRVYAGKLMEARTETRIALIAITAEQAYLANGSYPVSLEDLNYSFETTDAMDSKKRPLSYELDEHGKPRISSVVDPKIRWLFAPEEKKSSLRKKSRKATN